MRLLTRMSSNSCPPPSYVSDIFCSCFFFLLFHSFLEGDVWLGMSYVCVCVSSRENRIQLNTKNGAQKLLTLEKWICMRFEWAMGIRATEAGNKIDKKAKKIWPNVQQRTETPAIRKWQMKDEMKWNETTWKIGTQTLTWIAPSCIVLDSSRTHIIFFFSYKWHKHTHMVRLNDDTITTHWITWALRMQ